MNISCTFEVHYFSFADWLIPAKKSSQLGLGQTAILAMAQIAYHEQLRSADATAFFP
jgi:hypothetical protein